jgi:hypothetical protein
MRRFTRFIARGSSDFSIARPECALSRTPGSSFAPRSFCARDLFKKPAIPSTKGGNQNRKAKPKQPKL